MVWEPALVNVRVNSWSAKKMSAYISLNKVSSDETPFYLFTDSVNKSGGSCIIIND